MIKFIYIFKIILVVSLVNLKSNEPNKEKLFKIQDKILSCIVESAKKQTELETNGLKLFKLKKIINLIEEYSYNEEYYFDMNVTDESNYIKVELYLNSYYKFVSDEKIVNNHLKLGQKIEYHDIFQKYFFHRVFSFNYFSENFSYTSDLGNPIITYVKVVNNEVILLNKSEIINEQIENDNTESFFINENCYTRN